MIMRTASRLSMIAVAAAVLLHAGRAWAPWHIVVIDQVFFGTEDCPNAQYVIMRLVQPGMTIFQNQRVRTQNADGGDAGDFGTFGSNLSNGVAGANAIIGTADAAGLFGIDMDQEVSGQLVFADGRVCFAEFPPGSGTPVDCVAYGNFTGDNGANNMPAAAPVRGMALVRQSDTGNDQNDFVLAAPAPRNNDGEMGTLGVCPGGASTPTATEGDGATPTPTVTGGPTLPPSGCVGDCNGDGEVGINELILGVGISLGSQAVGACASFDCQGTGMVPINCLIQGVGNSLEGCPPTPTPTTGNPLVRRFSIDPAESQFISVIGPGGGFPSFGFQGFLELTATSQPGPGALVFVDLTDASDYLSIDIPLGGTAVCLKILRDQLPVASAGLLACGGGLPLGIQITQDHHLGEIGTCSGGDNRSSPCSADADCPGSTCFTADTCAEAGGVGGLTGTVEGESGPHPGICNGPIVGAQDTEVSPPGTLVIAPDGNGIIHGIPAELSQEVATPCGDEGVIGRPVRFGLTSGRSVSQILNYNNDPGSTLDSPIVRGAPFACQNWAQEDGPGTLVVSATNLDTEIAPGSFADIVAQFVLVD
jgi:hypothetical protein